MSAPEGKSLNITAQLLLLGVAAIWGWTFVIVKAGLEDVETFTLLFYRFTLAFLILIALFWPKLRFAESRLWIKGGIIGLTLFAGYWFQTWGLNFTTATKSAFLTGMAVVLVPIFGALFFKDKVPKWPWIGAGCSAVGLILILLGGSSEALGVNIGDFFSFLCAISFALQIVLISHFTQPKNYLPILVAQIGAVALLSGIGMLIFEGPSFPTSQLAWEAILITAVFATAIAFWIQMRYQPESTAAQTAIIFATEPVFAAAAGFAFLGEMLFQWQWLGAALILSAILVSQLPFRDNSKRPDSSL